MIKNTKLLLKRSRFLREFLRRPLLAEFVQTARSELQSTRDLLNFNPAETLAGMYRDERRASLIHAGTGLVTAVVSVFHPPVALITPLSLYGGYKAANLFRPAAFIVGASLGIAGALHYKQPAAVPEPGLIPPPPATSPSAPQRPPVATSLAALQATLTRT